eukprot:CAMPEP_0113627398 /NCGR_PEP_ID=MMETSP0017_2-20120614/14187_1 /TAXON_ID=2856 /ORGANISM="Cylindrotheca closterium" /LENGTH=1399 /DNA_ID=CAMNT_0000537647 /DNA_START=103 /DNA_END=4302 /DNA_ORIENTATION=+ /assembly_acc=CAM_ASM_000147
MHGVIKDDDNDERSFQYSGVPEDDAWLISRILFLWQNKLFKRASVLFKKGEGLQQEDLLPLPPRDRGEVIIKKFDDAWDNQDAATGGSGKKLSNEEDIKAGAPKLVKTIRHILGWQFVFAGFVKAVNTALQFGFPLLLNGILVFIEDYQKGVILDTDPWHVRYRGYLLALLLFFVMGSKALTENNYFHIVNRGSFNVKTAISVAVYNKSLRLSNVERQSTTLGELVNLMQVDASKIEVFIPQIHVLWDGMFQIIGYMSILYLLIGPSCFAGLLVMILAGPIQGVVMKKLFGMNRLMVRHTDARVESINEALQGIQGVKMYTWEENVRKRIEGYRNEELKHLKSAAYLQGFSRAYMGALPGVVAVVSFLVYSLTEDADISASRLFASIVAFDQLRFPLMFYPMSLAQLVQAQVSAARLEIFLSMGEIASNGATGKGTYSRERCSKGGVTIKDADIYWSDPEVPLESKGDRSESGTDDTTEKSLGASSDDDASVSTARDDTGKALSDEENVLRYPKAALKNLNVTIENGELCAVVGRVASGKSTLCSAVLNETFLAKGEITLQGEVAYAAQSPWILNATVRENILFGKPMDEDRYNRVIRQCQLEHDLTLLEDGDLTDIGEKGINLSGGQKARVSVARAAYSDADVVILDDPLSALDPEVAAALFNDCITGDLMAGKTRLLVTNQLQFLSQCDHVVVLKKGEVMEDGTATELLANKESEVNRLLAKLAGKSSKKVDKEKMTKEDISVGDRKSSIATAKNTKLLTKEERNVGAVEASVYLKYIKAGGGRARFAFVFLAYIFTAANSAASVSWVSYWTADPNYKRHGKEFYLGMYFMLAVTLGLFTFMRSYLLAYFNVKASERLHNDLLKSILRAPMSFFDTTPIGRILSRFSKDVYSVDLELGGSIDFVLFCVLTIVVSLLSIIAVTPWFGVAVIPLGFIYFQYLQYFRAVSRETKRLDSISRSPVYAQFSETLGGLTTIRAYGEPDRFMNEFEGKVDTNTQSLYNNKSADRWLSTRLELLGSSIAGITAALAVNLVISNSGGGIGAGAPVASLAGLSLTYAISVTSLLQWTVRTFSNMENAMNATERMLFYTEETPEEAPFTADEFSDKKRLSRDSEDKKPYTVAAASAGGKTETLPSDWPQTGGIDIQDLYMKYRKDTPMVLKGLNVSIKGGERVGVVGRTGSGKSSLLLSLLRLVEPNLDELNGDYKSPVSIDGVDILRIGLTDLRSKLGIIPQNPVLFSGTIKINMDPFDEYTTEEIWKALEQCGMRDSVEEMPGQLEADVAEGGQNLSNGMRQMLVLGRALLRQNKILFLDEATASVDIETDREIQRTLREAFKGCTVLTIAHRINTIMDSDKILVLKDGRAVEFAAPDELLKDETSIFSEIVRHAQADEDGEQLVI